MQDGTWWFQIGQSKFADKPKEREFTVAVASREDALEHGKAWVARMNAITEARYTFMDVR